MKATLSSPLLFLFSLLSVVVVEVSAYDNTKMCCLVNQQRAMYGLPSLGLDPELTEAAQEHSDDMARTGIMDHTGSDGSDPGTRVENCGYNWQSVAENIAFGFSDEESCMYNWMNSPGHRANILSADNEHFGSAVSYSSDGLPYYTQDFGSLGGSAGNYPECPTGYRDDAGNGGSGGSDYSSNGYDTSYNNGWQQPTSDDSTGYTWQQPTSDDSTGYTWQQPTSDDSGYTWTWTSSGDGDNNYGSNSGYGGTTWTYYY